MMEVGQLNAARSNLSRALAIQEEIHGSEHEEVARTLSELAAVLMLMDLFSEARPLLERAYAIAERAFLPDHPTRRKIEHNLNLVR
jgi:hypothetical protein